MQSTIAARQSTGGLNTGRMLLAGTVAAAAIAVAALAAMFAPALLSKSAGVIADGSYAQVESARGAAFGAVTWDSSYDSVEATRSQVALPAGPADNSYQAVENNRSSIVLPAALSFDSESHRGQVFLPAGDTSYDQVEGLRAQR